MYLDRYAAGGPAYGYPGYGYPGYTYGYTLVPVMVAIPQRAVVRETVTEEWVDEPVRARAVTRSRVIQRRPQPGKRIKYSK